MKIYITSIFVDDQDQALEFYTGKLGFVKKHDIPLGQYRWLTVVSPDDANGVELLLEPGAHRAVSPFKQALKQDGIPFTSFEVGNIDQEYQRLKSLGVGFLRDPAPAGNVIIAVFDDTCGNLIQIMQRV
jgi:catechol 2,3-dioxygenase-like lactoylglutathione lyase family enzyme